ncbi:sensor histidine kinase [Fulvivirga ligni]|uniref:sensor histidine kinase n=1 Tax=Fulvivirga ligni TaxID=2904246 RepID=UPI001F2282BF|nr:sensor histidine kinase [Fulvivirga ligni]UII20375.1 sensor histidine kinase [Fulvivirga ligni]
MNRFVQILSLDKTYTEWSWERIRRHVIYWLFWLTFYGVLNGTLVDYHYADWFLLELCIMTVKIPYAYFIAYYLFPTLLPQKKYITLTLAIIVFAFISISIIVVMNRNLPLNVVGQPVQFFSGKTFYQALDLIYMASLVVVIKMVQQYYQQKQTNTQLMEEKMHAELQILKNQLQPHFLFNTLNNIYSLVIQTDKRAGDCVLMLSGIMSYMLYECNADMSSLSKEIAMIKDYVQLEKIRYGDRVELSMEINGDETGKVIAPLLLIPFVENAFKHGVSQTADCSWVRVDLVIKDDDLSLLVENKLPENPEQVKSFKSGVGLENVKKRLQLLYPDRHRLAIHQEDSFLINLNIQL